MNLKILVIGRNQKIVDDICEHLEKDRGYNTVKSEPDKVAMFDKVLTELPNVIILFLSDETPETIKEYNALKDIGVEGGCTMIVIADETDEKLFREKTVLNRVFFLSRPIPLLAMYHKLKRVEEILEKDVDRNMSVFREFDSENAKLWLKRKKILVVDDDVEQLILIRDLLDEFYAVSVFKTPEMAYKYMETHVPDLILLDYYMPGTSGLKMLRELKESFKYANIPVIFLLEMVDKNAIKQTMLEFRPQGYMVKPPKKSELVAKIIEILG